jgi:hypothetical protein
MLESATQIPQGQFPHRSFAIIVAANETANIAQLCEVRAAYPTWGLHESVKRNSLSRKSDLLA